MIINPYNYIFDPTLPPFIPLNIMEIPKNNYSLLDDKQVKEAITYALSKIDKNGYADFYYASYPWWNLEKLKYVAKQFVKQGYYANVVWLVNGRCQSVRIRKEPFSVNSRMEYSEPIY